MWWSKTSWTIMSGFANAFSLISEWILEQTYWSTQLSHLYLLWWTSAFVSFAFSSCLLKHPVAFWWFLCILVILSHFLLFLGLFYLFCSFFTLCLSLFVFCSFFLSVASHVSQRLLGNCLSVNQKIMPQRIRKNVEKIWRHLQRSVSEWHFLLSCKNKLILALLLTII